MGRVGMLLSFTWFCFPQNSSQCAPSTSLPSSSHLQLPWRMKCQLHSSRLLNRFWEWWMVRISYPTTSLLFQTPPLPGSWHFTCQRMAVSERSLKGRLAVSCWDALSVLWMRSATVRRSWGRNCKASSASEPAEAWMLTWVFVPSTFSKTC